jgi:hypothetical protein
VTRSRHTSSGSSSWVFTAAPTVIYEKQHIMLIAVARGGWCLCRRRQ